MKDAMHSHGSNVTVSQERARHPKKRTPLYCSICTSRIWFDPVHLTEPEGVPEPRLSWTLCKGCHQVLQEEISRSPVNSPLRLRIAIGIVASDRWPMAYSTPKQAYASDRKWIIYMAFFFVLTMLIHLAIIVIIASK